MPCYASPSWAFPMHGVSKLFLFCVLQRFSFALLFGANLFISILCRCYATLVLAAASLLVATPFCSQPYLCAALAFPFSALLSVLCYAFPEHRLPMQFQCCVSLVYTFVADAVPGAARLFVASAAHHILRQCVEFMRRCFRGLRNRMLCRA